VAELLSQLPNDMDVENMVEASYKVVMEHKLDKGKLHKGDSCYSLEGSAMIAY
jgi:hypothetical protein